jgi:uncharacterized protein (TIGR00251 family)
MAGLEVTQTDSGVVLAVKVVPAGSKTAVAGQLNGMLKIKLSAAPEKGKANQCLIDFLAERLGVRKNTVSIVSGATSPVKKVQIADLTVENVLGKLTTSSGRLIE